jgi:hypothetical protein
MPQYYAVLDNGQQPPKRGAKRRAAVSAYLAKQGITPSKAGSRSAEEKAARAAGRELFAQRKAVRKYVTSKGGKLSPMGERGKREKRLRAEGRAAYAASKKPKATVTTKITDKYAPTPYGKYGSKSASGDSWKRGKTGK